MKSREASSVAPSKSTSPGVVNVKCIGTVRKTIVLYQADVKTEIPTTVSSQLQTALVSDIGAPRAAQPTDLGDPPILASARPPEVRPAGEHVGSFPDSRSNRGGRAVEASRHSGSARIRQDDAVRDPGPGRRGSPTGTGARAGRRRSGARRARRPARRAVPAEEDRLRPDPVRRQRRRRPRSAPATTQGGGSASPASGTATRCSPSCATSRTPRCRSRAASIRAAISATLETELILNDLRLVETRIERIDKELRVGKKQNEPEHALLARCRADARGRAPAAGRAFRAGGGEAPARLPAPDAESRCSWCTTRTTRARPRRSRASGLLAVALQGRARARGRGTAARRSAARSVRSSASRRTGSRS